VPQSQVVQPPLSPNPYPRRSAANGFSLFPGARRPTVMHDFTCLTLTRWNPGPYILLEAHSDAKGRDVADMLAEGCRDDFAVCQRRG